jgi:hypothetical protein
MYVSPNVAIPLLGILTYTKYMLVYALNHTSHISFVNDNFITWQFTQQPFPLNTHTFSNSHFTSVIYIKSWNLTEGIGAIHLPTITALLMLPNCCYCTTLVVPPANHMFIS